MRSLFEPQDSILGVHSSIIRDVDGTMITTESMSILNLFSGNKKKLASLKRLNVYMAVAHGVQAFLILLIASDFSRGITAEYLVFDKASQSLVNTSRTLFDFELAWGIAGFSVLSMLFHMLIATKLNKRYEQNLKKGMNPYRWYEYSLSASLMIVLIAILSGVFDLSTLLLMFGVTAIMNLMGLVMEVHKQSPKLTNWLSYWIGVLAGALPWIVIATYFWASATAPGASEGPPTFVYFIWGSLFLFFNCFAINMFLQYKKWGRWSDYLYGERVYVWLSLAAKSALLWQVYVGTLQP